MKPYLELPILREEVRLAKKIGFSVKITSAYAFKSGIVAVHVHWDAKHSPHRVHYAHQRCTTYTTGGKTSTTSVTLQFNDSSLKWKHDNMEFPLDFTVGLQFEKEKKMDLLGFKNYGYGATVYFAPEGWNSLVDAIDLLENNS